jgi:hypothetical protein
MTSRAAEGAPLIASERFEADRSIDGAQASSP